MTTTKQQTQAAQQAQIRGVTSLGVKTTTTSIISKSAEAQAYGMADIFSTMIRLGTNLGMGIKGFLTAKKDQKKQAKLTEAKQTSRNAIETTLENIYQYGLSLIEQVDISPQDPAFDRLLTSHISEMTGYKGGCDGDIYAPESKTIWFRVKGGRITPEPGVTLPDNADALWMLGCKNLVSRWTIAYQRKLVLQKRSAELDSLQTSLSKNNLGMSIGFGAVTSIIVIILLFNILKMAKNKRKARGTKKKRSRKNARH